MGTCINARMSSNFGQIPPLNTDLAALEHLKNRSSTFSRLLLIRSFLGLHVLRPCIISWMSLKFGQIRQLTRELASLACLKSRSPLFLSCYMYDPILFKLAGFKNMNNILEDFKCPKD